MATADVSSHFIREWSYHAIGSSSGLVQAHLSRQG
jgi:hypothetical protein